MSSRSMNLWMSSSFHLFSFSMYFSRSCSAVIFLIKRSLYKLNCILEHGLACYAWV